MNTIKFSFQTRWGANLLEKMLFFGHFSATEILVKEELVHLAGTEHPTKDNAFFHYFVVSADIPDFSHYRDIEDLATWIHDHELEYDPMGEGK